VLSTDQYNLRQALVDGILHHRLEAMIGFDQTRLDDDPVSWTKLLDVESKGSPQ
jgi:hypothetical protein